MNAVELQGVVLDYAPAGRGASVRALDSVSLELPAGEVVGLLGPNGSGKSSLLKVVAGLLRPSAGTCRIFGLPSTNPEARRRLGYLPETPDFCPQATGREIVSYLARLASPRGGMPDSAVDAALAAVGMAGSAGRRAGAFSQGMRQRLGLAQALLPQTRLLVLDEPTSGLDPVGVAEFCRLIGTWRAAGISVFLSSHQLAQMARICDRVVFLNAGRIVRQVRIGDLRRARGSLALEVDALPAEALSELRDWLSARGACLRAVEPSHVDLERVFLEAAGSATPGKT